MSAEKEVDDEAMDPNTLFASVVFGSIGMGLFIYGKKQQRLPHLVAGVALMVVPYVVPGVALWLVCAAVTAAPFVLPV